MPGMKYRVDHHGGLPIGGDEPLDLDEEFPAAKFSLEIQHVLRGNERRPQSGLGAGEMFRVTNVDFIVPLL